MKQANTVLVATSESGTPITFGDSKPRHHQVPVDTGLGIAHLIEQARRKLGMTQDQVAHELGVPRSSFARHISVNGRVPRRFLLVAIEWLATSLGLRTKQVEQFVQSRSAGPIALLELDATQYYQFDADTPREIAATLIRRWKNSTVTIFAPVVPPPFLLTKQVRNVLDESQGFVQGNFPQVEQARQMHAAIARHIWLHPEQLPHRWELILPERTITAMRNIDGLFSGFTTDAMTQLSEIWHHDFEGERNLAIRVLPECDGASSILRHFADVRTVIFINDDCRWKELSNLTQVQVTSVRSQDAEDALRWDREIIELARSLCGGEPPRRRLTPVLGDLRDYRRAAIELRTHLPRIAA